MDSSILWYRKMEERKMLSNRRQNQEIYLGPSASLSEQPSPEPLGGTGQLRRLHGGL